MEQQHVVLMVDEALYPKPLELKWSMKEYKNILIPSLGGLDIAMNILGIIGRHMNESGLSELCVRYDHVNYARWGTLYLAGMSVLPPEVLVEFEEGNFVVKRTDRRFHHISLDQSTEWLNATG
ncbi:hypothetical protein LSH36_87g04012 [Paralvinella palmiformis]|uniref:Uncharacterized protein n=1 Tax=Paralvinella palmiformis TaxID=53620 RepID=A0AAD9K1X6_9ANNE|nr:hypothetical protein LSH36_87g04012 [Paralvinella palmiformis]